jgi:hypothetical protein
MSASPSTSPSEPSADEGKPRGLLLSLWDFIWNAIIRVLWLCGYATVTAIGVAVLFIRVGQGQDLLRLSAEQGLSLRNLLFLVSALLLGLALWYSARLLLSHSLQGERLNQDHSRFGRVWLPRAYGTLPALAIGIGFLLVDTRAQIAAWVLAALFLLLAAGLLWFFYKRRDWFMEAAVRARGLTEPSTARDRRFMVAMLSIGQLAALALLAAFVVWPVTAPQTLGTPAIVLLGLTGIALFGGLVLTYAFLANGLPAGTALALVLAVAFGFSNDNHWIRVDDQAPDLQRLAAPAHYQAWRQANPSRMPIDGRDPVILVAAAGGGIRAAYWAASALATLEQRVPGFTPALYAVSGVSGGSVGAAVYTGIKRQQLERGEAPADGTGTIDAVRRILGQDFLSPVVAGLLFPDLVQRFIPVPFPEADRQRFLELSFEHAMGAGDNPLSRPFAALYSDGYAYRLPALLLNTTIVDSGRRGILSNIAVAGTSRPSEGRPTPPDGFIDAVDLLAEGFSTQRVRLSAAAGASARFTYLSPAGSLTGPGQRGEQTIRLVDGGYFENSGAATLMDLLDLIDDQGIYPILILIRNDPQAPAVCEGRPAVQGLGPGPQGPPATDFLSELASPVRALLNARTARGRLTEVDAARRVEQDMRGAVIEISLAAVVQETRAGASTEAERRRIEQSLLEPPLGWSLSQAVRESMDTVMAEGGGGLQGEFANLTAVLNDQGNGYRPCRAR